MSITLPSSTIIPFKPNNTIRQSGEPVQQPPERTEQPLHYRWFRFENDAINDPRVLSVTVASRWIWVCLQCICSKNDGQLPSLKHTAIMLRMEQKELKAAIDDLIKVGLLERNQGVIRPADWDRLQCRSDADPTNAERQKRFRDRKSNALRNGPVTRYGNDTVHNTTEQNTTDSTEQNTTDSTEQNRQNIAEQAEADLGNVVSKVSALVVCKEASKQARQKTNRQKARRPPRVPPPPQTFRRNGVRCGLLRCRSRLRKCSGLRCGGSLRMTAKASNGRHTASRTNTAILPTRHGMPNAPSSRLRQPSTSSRNGRRPMLLMAKPRNRWRAGSDTTCQQTTQIFLFERQNDQTHQQRNRSTG
jgi:hypothetical protein